MIRAALLCLLAFPAAAQQGAPTCRPRDAVAAQLKETYGETSIFVGATENGMQLLEIFAAVNGTWTAVVVSPDGRACYLGAGEPWIATGVPQGEDG